MSANPKTTTPKVPVEERLFSLVLALLASEHGLSKADILSTVQGYRQRYQRGGDNASLERQFERDKDDVRELGIPLETVEPTGEAGNNQLLRYRIARGDYDIPADLEFTPAERTMLALAATVWREGSLSGQSQRALNKLRSLGVSTTDETIGFSPRVRTRDGAFEPLSTALDRGLIVEFDYLMPGRRDALRRTVAPLALVQHEGRWHVSGIDQDRGSERVFLLSRITSPVTLTRRSFTPEGNGHAERTLARLRTLFETQVADLRVQPATDAARRLALRADTAEAQPGDALRVHFTDLDVFADELAAYGPEVRVLAPDTLATAVADRLARVAALHGTPEVTR